MRLIPLNDVLIIEPDPNHFVSDNPEVVEIAKTGLIQLPNNNSLEKKSNSGEVISFGPDCHYPFKHGQKVYFSQWTTPMYVFVGEKRYRFLREYELHAVDEDV